MWLASRTCFAVVLLAAVIVPNRAAAQSERPRLSLDSVRLSDTRQSSAVVNFCCAPQGPAHSQGTTSSKVSLRGTAFGGGIRGVDDVLPNVGAGIELGTLRLSVGGQASIVVISEEQTATLLVSARAQYAFANRSKTELTWVPFVAAGLTRAVNFENGFNVGGGVEWGRAPFALRLEALAHAFGGSDTYFEFRAGVVFGR